MDENCRDLILNGLTSLFEQGNFSELLYLLEDYYNNPLSFLSRTPAQLNLSHIQRSSTLKITEIISFVHPDFKNISVEKLILPVLLSCIEIALWKNTEKGKGILREKSGDYFVYLLPVFIDFYFNTSGFNLDRNGEIKRIRYSIERLLYSIYKESPKKSTKLLIDSLAEKEIETYRKYSKKHWYGITSFVLTGEEDIINSIKSVS
ncbi:hypothetical protein C4588_02385 [Candidatus Parcubacteria bacterium]|nr:MAG: hypothetical protein C4588_02385 [Candidatus Parcubacteria bacterium]